MDKAIIFCMCIIWNMFLLAGCVYLIIKYNAWWVIIVIFLLGADPTDLTIGIRYSNPINEDH